MPPNRFKIPDGRFGADRLNAVSRKIINLAFAMGGSRGKHYSASKCNYVFPNGKPCFDEKRGDHDIDCPLCRGNGAYYNTVTDIPIILSDSVNPLSGDKYGVTFDDRLTLSIPVYVDPGIIQVSKKGQVHIVKDKFAVYDHLSKQWAIFIMSGEPSEPYLGGPLYRIVEVTSQYTQRQNTEYEKDVKIYYNVDERDLLAEVNKDILGFNHEGEESVYNDNIIITDSEPVIIDGSSLEDDWQ